MRVFSSYGSVDNKIHYYAPRTELIDRTCEQLLGKDPINGGHYITIWAPRQTGKSWATNQVLYRLKEVHPEFDTVKLNLQDLEDKDTGLGVYRSIIGRLRKYLDYTLPMPDSQEEFVACFSQDILPKPLILILDEFDALQETALHGVVAALRNIYNIRRQEIAKSTFEKTYLLHGVALIGVRSVLGIENETGSPFNIQRSVQIPNLTQDEVTGMFHWYEEESGQKFAPGVIDRAYYEMKGQPGLTSWLGELLTEQYNRHRPEITMRDFRSVYSAAVHILPNNNIVNIVSKAKKEPYKSFILEMFQTSEKLHFRYDDPVTNYLYMNGVIDHDETPQYDLMESNIDDLEEMIEESDIDTYYLKFPNPFIQKRLFNFFAHELFRGLKRLYDPLADLSNTITDTTLNIPNVLRYYEDYLHNNRKWLFKQVPRRKTDERIYEAVYHFSLYMYLSQFMQSYRSQVLPEFPTGNGQIDLLIRHGGQIYGLEVKSFINRREYQYALDQAAGYAHELAVQDIWLLFFIEVIDDDNRQQLEKTYIDPIYNVTVHPIFITIGTME